jgi:hypothetical protein
MRRVKVVTTEANRYFVSETTSGTTSDIYLTDGVTTLRLEDCLIWDLYSFEDSEFDEIVAHCKANNNIGVDGFEGWSIVEEAV